MLLFHTPLSARIGVLQTEARRGDLPILVFVAAAPDVWGFVYRVHNVVVELRRRGVSAHWFTLEEVLEVPWRDVSLGGICIYRIPWGDRLKSVYRVASEIGAPIFFDIDDWVFSDRAVLEQERLLGLDRSGDSVKVPIETARGYLRAMQAADEIVVSTGALQELVKEDVGRPSRLLRNFPSFNTRSRSAMLTDDVVRAVDLPPRVLYLSGTASHTDDFATFWSGIVEFLRAEPSCKLRIVGPLAARVEWLRDSSQVEHFPFTHPQHLAWHLQGALVNLAPLRASLFNQSKSALKHFEAALAAVPTIASPTIEFERVIDHGRSGWLATSHDEVASALSEAYRDALDRRSVGRTARDKALGAYSDDWIWTEISAAYLDKGQV